MENKFKVGNKVVCIRTKRPSYFTSDGTMDYLLNKGAIVTVTNVYVDDFHIEANLTNVGRWNWWSCHYEDFELAQNDKVIINQNCVILKKDGKTYKSICKPDDQFDAEKGVMLAMLKSFGVKYQDIADLVNNAKIIKPKENKKITLQEFWDSKEKLAIHCNTQEKSNKLLKEFDELGKTWYSGRKYTEAICYNIDRNGTYDNSGCYCFKQFYINNGYKVYEFEDIILPEKQQVKTKKARNNKNKIKK